MKLSHRHFLLMSFLACGPALAEPACNLPGSFAHATRSDGTRTVRTGQGALLFTAPLAVNTDGAPNSYHPDDPWGRRLALNNICNGANAVLADGRKLDYRSCPKLIAAFEQSRRSGWQSPKIQFYAVATEKGRPCTIRTGKYAGYFVSTTSLAADSRKPACDPGHWLDSNSVPFAIYPGHHNFTSRGVGTGDLVVIRNPANGRISYGIVGDRGPAWGLGEVSLAFASDLRGGAPLPTTRSGTYRYGLAKADVLILSSANLREPYAPGRIRAEADKAFRAWGGAERLQRCLAR
jgi:hypothetical protein